MHTTNPSPHRKPIDGLLDRALANLAAKRAAEAEAAAEAPAPSTLGVLDCGTCGRTHYWCKCS